MTSTMEYVLHSQLATDMAGCDTWCGFTSLVLPCIFSLSSLTHFPFPAHSNFL